MASRRAWVWAVVAAVCVACSEDDSGERATGAADGTTPAAEAGTPPLSGEYLLDSAEGYEPVAGTTIHIQFSDDAFGFSAGCNHYSGTFSVQDDVLVVGALASTQMGCEPNLHAQDAWLADFVQSGPAVQLEGDLLTLTGEDATLVFLAREVADPDRPLTGRLWTIDTLLTGQAASSIPAGVNPTVTFNDDGTVVIETGCNTGNGSYQATDAELSFSQVAYTRMACLDQGAAGVESHVQEVFAPGTATYTIEAARLTIERDSTGIAATTE